MDDDIMKHSEIMRVTVDCREYPDDIGCTLVISGSPDEVERAAVDHLVIVHDEIETPQLHFLIRSVMKFDKEEQGNKPVIVLLN